MRKIMMLFVVAIGVLLLGGSANQAEACLICNSEQFCEEGSGGSSCAVEVVKEEQWCQYSLECSSAAVITPLDMSAAGTFLAANTVRTEQDGRAVSECNGFITRHGDASSEVRAVRI
jgi:hypothetical protein